MLKQTHQGEARDDVNKSAISKVFKHIVYVQLYCNLNKNSLLSENQSGLYYCNSTAHVLIHTTTNWFNNMNNGRLYFQKHYL